MPYMGPDVAAMTPMQMAAFDSTNAAASAYGLPTAATTGLPEATTYANGMQGYSSFPMYQQAVQDFAKMYPGQYEQIMSMFVNRRRARNRPTRRTGFYEPALPGEMMATGGAQTQGPMPAQRRVMPTFGPQPSPRRTCFDQSAGALNSGIAMTQQAGAYQPQMVDATNVQPYMNPYQQQVIDASNAELQKQAAMAQNTLDAQASAAGAFGGSRMAWRRQRRRASMQTAAGGDDR